jgi:hypothetical protein
MSIALAMVAKPISVTNNKTRAEMFRGIQDTCDRNGMNASSERADLFYSDGVPDFDLDQT